MLLLGGNNILVHKLLIQAVQNLFQPGPPIWQSHVEGDRHLVYLGRSRVYHNLYAGHRYYLGINQGIAQIKPCGDLQGPFLIPGIKSQRQTGEGVGSRELPGNNCWGC